MNIQDRVTSLEQAIKLKELGVKQELIEWDYCYILPVNICLVRWSDKENMAGLINPPKVGWTATRRVFNECIKAFDGAQIDEMLPNFIYINTYEYQLAYNPHSKIPQYGYNRDCKCALFASGGSHLEAKTNLLIMLLEKGLVKSQCL